MKALLIASAVLLAACVAPVAYSRAMAPDLYRALDSQPDGYGGFLAATGARYKIVSTRASTVKLCRVVTIKAPGSFKTKSFCKAKGGEWR